MDEVIRMALPQFVKHQERSYLREAQHLRMLLLHNGAGGHVLIARGRPDSEYMIAASTTMLTKT